MVLQGHVYTYLAKKRLSFWANRKLFKISGYQSAKLLIVFAIAHGSLLPQIYFRSPVSSLLTKPIAIVTILLYGLVL